MEIEKVICLEDGVKELCTAHSLYRGQTLLHTKTGVERGEREEGETTEREGRERGGRGKGERRERERKEGER